MWTPPPGPGRLQGGGGGGGEVEGGREGWKERESKGEGGTCTCCLGCAVCCFALLSV